MSLEGPIVFHDAAVIAVLKSSAVQARLEAMARQIVNAAGDGEYAIDTTFTPTRVHVRVVTADHVARKEEALNRSLLRSLDAGRG